MRGFARDIAPGPPRTGPGGSPIANDGPLPARWVVRATAVVAAAVLTGALAAGTAGGGDVPSGQEAAGAGAGVLKLLGIEPSAESVDYVRDKTPFQLHSLLTEQRHPKTWHLGERVREDTLAGLKMLSSVDEDIRAAIEELVAAPEVLEQAARAVEEAILDGRKIYVYGCGATGRLAKQMESTFWRPFWRGVRADPKLWAKVRRAVSPSIEEDLIGEMTGGDRALISSLEGFEDLQLIGRLQLRDRGVEKGDVVICVTEGGETSSVIGTVRTALEDWKKDPGYAPEESRKRLYFVYNNPDDRLLPFERSRVVLEEPGITKINLTTGPQAITGSTRMQATTIETTVVAAVIETAVGRVLRTCLSAKERARLGFGDEAGVADRLRGFGEVLNGARQSLTALAALTDLEAETYAAGRFSTYFADRGLITVFIDSTERSPTFRLLPLDTVREPERRAWIQVWAAAGTLEEGWQAFLGRAFRGLAPDLYGGPFASGIEDPYLRRAALESLKKAGDEQGRLYDFSFSERNLKERGPGPGDIAVMVCLTPEEAEIDRPGSYFRRFAEAAAAGGAGLGVLMITDRPPKEFAGLEQRARRAFAGGRGPLVFVPVFVPADGDPFGIRQQMAAKMLLNAHSTAVMAKLGKVVGNTMTNVSPSNLKLIGRATYLIQSHVNDILAEPAWVKVRGARAPVSYGEANAVLYDAIEYLRDKQKEGGQTAEVAFSIVRILESLKEKRGVDRAEALTIVRTAGLSAYLSSLR